MEIGGRRECVSMCVLSMHVCHAYGCVCVCVYVHVCVCVCVVVMGAWVRVEFLSHLLIFFALRLIVCIIFTLNGFMFFFYRISTYFLCAKV